MGALSIIHRVKKKNKLEIEARGGARDIMLVISHDSIVIM